MVEGLEMQLDVEWPFVLRVVFAHTFCSEVSAIVGRTDDEWAVLCV